MNAIDLIQLGKTLAQTGMIYGSGGNLSCRIKNQIIITASGANLGQLQERDLVVLALDGTPLETCQPQPSSEWALHVGAYRVRPQARVVIHAHPPKAITLGLLGHSLPALTPDQYLHLGSHVPLIRYITPTTKSLAVAVANVLETRPAVLLQNHGVVVTAESIEHAQLRLILLEEACHIYLGALAVGKPRVLSEENRQALDNVTGGRYKMREA